MVGGKVNEDDAALLHIPDLDALSVDELLAVIGLEEPITAGDFQLARFTDIEGIGTTAGIEGDF